MRLYGEAAEASGKQKEVSDHYGEGPPVPIPNTEVKLASAEDTWLEAAWENRTLPTHCIFFAVFIVLSGLNAQYGTENGRRYGAGVYGVDGCFSLQGGNGVCGCCS